MPGDPLSHEAALQPPHGAADHAPVPRREDVLAHERWQRLLRVGYQADDVTMEAVPGTLLTIDRIAALHQARPREILSVSPRPSGPVQPPVADSLLAQLQSGGTSVWITDESRIAHPAWQPLIQRHLAHGERIYSVPKIQQRFLIFDRQVAVIPLDPDNHGLGSLTIHSPALIQHLVMLFHEILARATPLVANQDAGHTWHAVLTLVASGAKDETIARKLDVSPRTVRRIVAEAMRECGVQSRFQLAVVAVRKGWLTPHHELDAGKGL